MFTRRSFLAYAALSLSSLVAPSPSCTANGATQNKYAFTGETVFDKIQAKAKSSNWLTLPIGELMGKIATELQGTPYVAATLELSPDREICSVNLEGLDCVTFFESVLDIARMLKKGGTKPNDMLKEIEFTRYRDGSCGDYSTRLHYTSDWFFDNQKKGVIRILAELPGSEPFTQKVSFMSSHPTSYRQLAAHADLVPKMKQYEDAINSRSLTFVPKAKIEAIEAQLKTGDIVGMCTSVAGLDIAHTGLVYRSSDGVAHFMDASSKKKNMKVLIEPESIHETLAASKDWTGAIFARPLEPKT